MGVSILLSDKTSKEHISQSYLFNLNFIYLQVWSGVFCVSEQWVCNSTDSPLLSVPTNIWWQTQIYRQLSSAKRIGLEGLRDIFFKSLFIQGETADFSSHSLSASLSYISTQSYLDPCQRNKDLSFWPLKVWGFGGGFAALDQLDSSFCKKQLYYLFTSLVLFPWELHWDLKKIPTASDLAAAFWDFKVAAACLTVGNVKWRQQNNREKRKRGCNLTSLHVTGLQKFLAAWWGNN